METIIYEKMRSAPKNSFKEWLEEFLIFTKTDKISPKDLVKASSLWEPCMSSKEGFLSNKQVSPELLKYSVKCYLFYHIKEARTPKELTNMTEYGVDSERLCNFFNMNFFNLEDTKIPVLGFIEAFNDAVNNLNIPGVDSSELLMRFFRIYFFNSETQEFKLKPIVTRFFELVTQLTGEKITSNPNKTINIPESFYKKITPSESEIVKETLEKDEKPSKEDYAKCMEFLKKYEKEETNILWTSRDETHYLLKSKSRKCYLVNNYTGTVLNVFDEKESLSNMISKSEKIISN